MYSRLVLNLIVFLLPTQLGLHFWPDFSRVAGIRLDYLSPTLYLTDIFLLLYLLLNITKISKFLKPNFRFMILASCFILLNTYFAISPLNSLFWWLRTVIYLLFAFTLNLNRVKIKDILQPLTYSVILVVTVQTLQFLRQSSLDGLFYYFGERHFTFDTPNLARFTFLGQNLLRVPSLFSHPNSLAGYLLLVLLILLQHSSAKSRLTVGIIFFALVLTFSKSAFFALFVYFLFSKHSKSLILLSIISSLLFLVLSTTDYRPSTIQLPYFFSSRLDLLTSAHSIVAKNPLLGIGLGNFIPALSQELLGSHLTTQYLQPVHNIFILLLTELGFPFFAFLLYKSLYFFRTNHFALITMLTLVSITGFFDHYWLTLPQNRLLLSLLLGIL